MVRLLHEVVERDVPRAVVRRRTNKVYGERPNFLPLVELDTRWEYAREEDRHGVNETMSIDRCMHSVFGASKTAADVMTQEYGHYYGLNTAVFRGGCLTGPNHSGVELHGFLSHLVKVAVRGDEYTVFGYKAKQVRDQIHSADVIAAFDAFAAAPRPGEVYNLGGGRANSASILECFAMLEERLDKKIRWRYVERNRRGDHICYISDLRKLSRDYPGWTVTRRLDAILDQIVAFERDAARFTAGGH